LISFFIFWRENYYYLTVFFSEIKEPSHSELESAPVSCLRSNSRVIGVLSMFFFTQHGFLSLLSRLPSKCMLVCCLSACCQSCETNPATAPQNNHCLPKRTMLPIPWPQHPGLTFGW
jgi:hypothetical protein